MNDISDDAEALQRAAHHLDAHWYRPMRSRRTAEEALFWESLDAGVHHALDGSEVDIRCMGDGPAVLLIHGDGGRGSQFMALMRSLAAAGLRAVAVDLPGFGDRRLRSVTVETLARALLAIHSQAAGGWHGIVTHSMGNLWAFYAAARGLACSRYVAVSGVFEASLCNEIFRVRHGLSHADMACLQALRLQREGVDSVRDQDPAQVLQHTRLGQQMLIAHAGRDEVIPTAHGRHWARRLPGSGYIEVSDASHVSVLDQPSLIDGVTRFLMPDSATP